MLYGVSIDNTSENVFDGIFKVQEYSINNNGNYSVSKWETQLGKPYIIDGNAFFYRGECIDGKQWIKDVFESLRKTERMWRWE